MNTQTIQSVQPRPAQVPPDGWQMAKMRFWDKPHPNLDPPFRDKLVHPGTGWLDNAEVELLDAAMPEDKPVEVQWMTGVEISPAPTTLAGRLGQMAAAYDWDLPANLLGPVSNARAALKEQRKLTPGQQDQMVQEAWPEVWHELRLYERRRLLAEAELGSWNYQSPVPWSHARWEAVGQAAEELEKHLDVVNGRSYVGDEDPLLTHKPVAGLDSFLPHEAGYPVFHIG